MEWLRRLRFLWREGVRLYRGGVPVSIILRMSFLASRMMSYALRNKRR
jgi:hypothetical protein